MINKKLAFGFNSKLPVILQDEYAECGLACLAMITSYYGFNVDLAFVRNRYSVSNLGMDLKKLMDIANDMHLSSRAVKVDIENIGSLKLPSIIHWRMEHFVVLKSVTKRKITVHDPALGERTYSPEEFSKNFTGIALELEPSQEFTIGEEKQKIGFRHFWSNISGLNRSLFQFFVFSIALQIFYILSPMYIQIVVDDVITHSNQQLLIALLLGFGLLLFLQIATSAVRDYSILKVSATLNMQMATNLFSHLIKLPLRYFESRHVGDVISRFSSVGEIREAMTRGLVVAIVDGVMAIVGLWVMFLYSLQLTFIVIGILSVFILIKLLSQKSYQEIYARKILLKSFQDSNFIENVRAIQLIKSFQLEGKKTSQWQNHLANVINADIRINQWDISYSTIKNILFGVENLLIVYLGALTVIENQMTLGMLFAFLAYKVQFVSSLDSFINQVFRIKMLDLHFSRIADIVLSKTEGRYANEKKFPIGSSTGIGIGDIKGKIEVKNLGFRYNEEETVFKNINFTINPGETVAIIGSSGCGKSTLIKCLLGLISPTEGDIFIDDTPLTQVPRYRLLVSAVMQDDQLLSGSIADNIACFDPKLDMERIISSAQKANIDSTIMKLPMQYSTLVGDMGSNLSGGQKQRIVLARALYREPKILFMDEATSHLDIKTENFVNAIIKGLNITRVIVAHRLETIASADRVINLEEMSS